MSCLISEMRKLSQRLFIIFIHMARCRHMYVSDHRAAPRLTGGARRYVVCVFLRWKSSEFWHHLPRGLGSGMGACVIQVFSVRPWTVPSCLVSRACSFLSVTSLCPISGTAFHSLQAEVLSLLALRLQRGLCWACQVQSRPEKPDPGPWPHGSEPG